MSRDRRSIGGYDGMTREECPMSVIPDAGTLAGEAPEPQLTPDEIRERAKETGGRPLADILRDLEARA